METTINTKERDNYAIIEITLPDNTLFRITVWDSAKSIKIQTPDGALKIEPHVSNEISVGIR